MDEVKYLTANYNFPKDRKISSLHSLDELKNTCERIIAEDFGLDGKVSEISDANMVVSISDKDDADTIGHCLRHIGDYLSSIISDVTIQDYLLKRLN